MAGISITIGGVAFGAISTSATRSALDCKVNSAQYQIMRFHIPGVNGNYLVRGGRTGRVIACALRYRGTVSGVGTNYKLDMAAWENAAVTLTDQFGDSYTRCQLQPNGMRIYRGPRATGLSAGQVIMDVIAVFDVDS